jgi:hypothetical protein
VAKTESRTTAQIRICTRSSRHGHNETQSKRNLLESIIDSVKSLSEVNAVTSQGLQNAVKREVLTRSYWQGHDSRAEGSWPRRNVIVG